MWDYFDAWFEKHLNINTIAVRIFIDRRLKTHAYTEHFNVEHVNSVSYGAYKI